jgi:hypothetical protein
MVLAGVMIKADLENSPQYVNKEFKMQLGSSESTPERAKAIELTNDFFRYLADGYFATERAKVHSIGERFIYVSYPAKWEIEQRSITVGAAENAFGEEVRSLDEPTAALLYCIQSKDIVQKARDELRTNSASNVLIVDMGAGTTDLVLFRYIPNGPTAVISKYPEPGKNSVTFGGREVDSILGKHFASEYTGWEDENDVYIAERCKTWKEEVSKQLNDSDEAAQYLPDRRLKPKLGSRQAYDRRKICTLLRDYLHQFPQMINGAIEEGKNNDSQFHEEDGRIDFVVLTGGHSQWFFVDEMLRGHWLHGLPGNENLGSGIFLPLLQRDPWRTIKTLMPQQIVFYGLCMSGMPIQVIQLSNSDVWLELEMGRSKAKKEKIIGRSIRLPHRTTIEKEFQCSILSDEVWIPITITPLIGRRGDDYLDPINIQLGTTWGSDFVNWLFNEGRYRSAKVKLTLTCILDENQLLTLSGSVKTPGWTGYEETISMSPTQLAENIRKSYQGGN